VPRFDGGLNPVPHLLIEYHVARALLPAPQPPLLDSSTPVNLATTMCAIAVPYAAAALAAGAPFTASLQQYGLNQFAAPEVGEGFVTSSLIAAAAGAGVAPGAMPPTYRDHYHLAAGVPQVVLRGRTWGSHWAGVVARDGADVVTLENYARTVEDAMQGADTRYYFQMYNTNPAAAGDTWQQAWTTTPMQPIAAPGPPPPAPHPPATHEPASPGAQSFANPITTRVTVRDAYYDAIAAGQYGAVNLNMIKNDHVLIAGAPDAHQEMLEVLKGLQYARTRLNAGQPGLAARVHSWDAALAAAFVAARFRANLQAIGYTRSQILAMHTH
jgi:hypothetical protein